PTLRLYGEVGWGHAPPRSQMDQLVRAVAIFEVPVGVGNVTPQDAADALQLLLAVSWQVTA
ncbi:MAG: hypothetical protein ABW115_19620, partial [Candidatus Thiodiazotropha sp. 6PLUC6]